MSEDEIKAWFFKYGQYANARDMALIKAIEAAIKPQRTWQGLTDEELSEVYNRTEWDTVNGWEYERAIEAKLKERNI